MKMFRIIGRESRITIPWAIRQKAGFRPDDVVSFQLMEDDSVLVRRESTCGKEKNPGAGRDASITAFLDSLDKSSVTARWCIFPSSGRRAMITLRGGSLNEPVPGRVCGAGKACRGFLAMEENVADDRLYYRLGSMNMTGTGTEVDLERARYYFEKASELGNADALYGLGKLYLKPEFPDYDPAKAVEYLEEAAQKDNAFAKYQLGKLLCQGELVPKDIARGLPLLEELAENGVTFASYIAGKVYLKEEGWQDIKKAILYFRQAAEAGNPFAEYQLGRIYYFGNGVRADQEKGLEYLKGSAAHGNEYAANLLITIQQQHTWGVASCTASLIAQLGRIFQEQDQKQSQRQRPRMDRKHRREIEEKKQAMGIRD